MTALHTPKVPFDSVRRWMFEHALPLWADAGADCEYGGFLEELDMEAKPTAAAFKRLRVTCRQVYVFSHAALLGWARGDAVAQRGVEFLLAAERDGAWPRRLTRAGERLDATYDSVRFRLPAVRVCVALACRARC